MGAGFAGGDEDRDAPLVEPAGTRVRLAGGKTARYARLMSIPAVTLEAPDFVEEVERELRRLLPEQGAGTLLTAARHLVFAGGRRLRVRLVGACGGLMGTPRERLVAIAAAGEFIHAASLLHDDVVDEASLRRGAVSANARFGNAASVLGGDWLLSKAMELLAWHPDVVMGAVRTVGEMSTAAILEVEGRASLAGGLAAWRAVAVGKTGALFGWAAEACALAAGRTDAMPGLRAFGRHLGVAFQLADDLGDLVGASGKDRFSDLTSRTPSHPILVAAADLDFRRRLETLWAPAVVDPAAAAALGASLLDEARGASLDALDVELEAAFASLGSGTSAFVDELRALSRVFIAPLTAA
jgi:octaprenyl-diphosphate synthase